ncbi:MULTISPECIES: hypothetical protein [Halomonadaceae]|uniref:hypothetical protein n=1 Tax=Halomonadaceae TaxID=28256 RepID=UPI001599D6F5|nr:MULTISPECIES: hypothetical protein [Halomonas]QJQ94144.1 hypothetical protein HIO72_01790 [Halomonas sp. PA5]
MAYRINPSQAALPALQICDATSGSVRMALQYPHQEQEEDQDLLALKREEAIHNRFRRLFLRTTEQYLKGELEAQEAVATRTARWLDK